MDGALPGGLCACPEGSAPFAWAGLTRRSWRAHAAEREGLPPPDKHTVLRWQTLSPRRRPSSTFEAMRESIDYYCRVTFQIFPLPSAEMYSEPSGPTVSPLARNCDGVRPVANVCCLPAGLPFSNGTNETR